MTSNNKLFPAKSLLAGNSAISMTSEGNSALLPANVDRRPPLLLPLHVFLFVLYNKSLNDWSLRETVHFVSLKSEILGKQNELLPSGPVIKYLILGMAHDLDLDGFYKESWKGNELRDWDVR